MCVFRRQSLLHVLELSQRLIVIMFEGQSKHMSKEISFLLKEHEKHLTVLTWSNYSIVRPSKPTAPFSVEDVVLHNLFVKYIDRCTVQLQ